MKRKAKVIEKATQRSIAEWVDDYSLPDLEYVLDSITNKLKATMLKEFHVIVTEALKKECYFSSPCEPGLIQIAIGGEDSSLTPNMIEARLTLDEIARDLTRLYQPQPRGEQITHLLEWRDAFARAAKTLDEYIQRQASK